MAYQKIKFNPANFAHLINRYSPELSQTYLITLQSSQVLKLYKTMAYDKIPFPFDMVDIILYSLGMDWISQFISRDCPESL